MLTRIVAQPSITKTPLEDLWSFTYKFHHVCVTKYLLEIKGGMAPTCLKSRATCQTCLKSRDKGAVPHQTSSISCRFVLGEAVSQTKYYCSF